VQSISTALDTLLYAAANLLSTLPQGPINHILQDGLPDLLTFPWVGFHAARPGSGGQSPPRVSMAIAMSASGL
jgi:hypothetical protein